MPDRSDDSVIAMAREIADDAIRMIRADIELAKKELGSAMRRMLVSIALLMVAVLFLLIAVVEALGAVPLTFGPRLFGSNSWLPWLALGGVFLILAVLLGLFGALGMKRAFKNSKGVIDSIKEDVEWAKRLTKRGKSAS
jgi:hypothetical protein